MNRKILLFLMIAFVVSLSIVIATPAGPKEQISVLKSERYPTWDKVATEALAGNVTEFDFNGSTITQNWQGYFGNITGYIVLGDVNNNTLYDWFLASPQGEVYAVANDTLPDWTSIRCATQGELNAEDTRLNSDEIYDEDAVNRTFVVGGAPDQLDRFTGYNWSHPTFDVANQTIVGDSCPVVTLYNSSRQPSEYFKEVALTVSNIPQLVYTAIIAHTLNPWDESDGFDSRTHDFEMIVGEDGHPPNADLTATTTTYYFYLELQ